MVAGAGGAAGVAAGVASGVASGVTCGLAAAWGGLRTGGRGGAFLPQPPSGSGAATSRAATSRGRMGRVPPESLTMAIVPGAIFDGVPASVLYDVLRGMGEANCVLPPDVRAVDPRWRVAGPAFPVSGHVDQTLDRHESLLRWSDLLSRVPPRTVVVCQPNTRAIALMGELSARALKVKGVLGYLVDGACRDVDLVIEAGLPVFCTHFTPADITARWAPDALGAPVTIGTVTIAAGDQLVADRDGIVVVPARLAAEAAAEARRVIATESDMRKAVLSGMDPKEAYLKFGKF
jgi:4-hydroxy-4-methyl-2-oxoglutarate aldolase